jgi:Asp-tRNA(Asn)/Glu-tRNA(Gln) amidotransferase A subunit family amidase
MDEFAMGGDADAMRFRLARNPHDPAHQPGGSSAGSGVAVAEGRVDAALGTDTGGSVRFPASYCGVFGVKPTRGLVSHDGFVQFSKSLDTIGVLARDAETGGRVLASMAGPDPADDATRGVDVGDYAAAAREGAAAGASSLTVGVVTDVFGYNDRVESPVRGALDALEDAGAEVVDASVDGYEYAVPAWVAVGETELGAYLGANGVNYWRDSRPLVSLVEALDERLPDAPEEVQEPFLGSALYGAHLAADHGNRYYARAQHARRRFAEGVDDALAGVDVLASPTTPMLPPAWDDEGYLEDGSLYDAIRNTGPFNLSGHPAVSVPCATVDGLPVGLQFVGGWYDEETLFHAAGVWGDVHGEPYGV